MDVLYFTWQHSPRVQAWAGVFGAMVDCVRERRLPGGGNRDTRPRGKRGQGAECDPNLPARWPSIGAEAYSAPGGSHKMPGWSPALRTTLWRLKLGPPTGILPGVAHLPSGLLIHICTPPPVPLPGLCLHCPSHQEAACTSKMLASLRAQLSPTFSRKPPPTPPTGQSHLC